MRGFQTGPSRQRTQPLSSSSSPPSAAAIFPCFFRSKSQVLSMSTKIPNLYLKRQLFGFSRKTLQHALCTATTETQTQKLERIADEFLSLNKLERHDFSILFRLKLGMNKYGTATAGLDASASAGSGGESAAEAKVEKTAFDIKLEKFDAAAKIKIIKEVRTFTDLGLKEAKDLVEKAPIVLKKGVTKEEANPIIEKLKELGATVVLE